MKALAFILVLGGPIHKSAKLLKFILVGMIIIWQVNDQLSLEVYSVRLVSWY